MRLYVLLHIHIHGLEHVQILVWRAQHMSTTLPKILKMTRFICAYEMNMSEDKAVVRDMKELAILLGYLLH